MKKEFSTYFDELSVHREARATRERHGEAELVRRDGIPMQVTGCLTDKGDRAEAHCLTRQVELPDDLRVWIRPMLPGSILRRRGRLQIEPGTRIRFIDEADADVPSLDPVRPAASMERDMLASDRIRELVQAGSELFAGLLYAALCNTEWRHMATGQTWSEGWRSAGGTIASLRGEGSYMDWYGNGEEGFLDEQVLQELRLIGWEPVLPDDRASRTA
ncbi:MAG: hypothetical protein ACRYG8_28960 [Janthinobacterium lividum]